MAPSGRLGARPDQIHTSFPPAGPPAPDTGGNSPHLEGEHNRGSKSNRGSTNVKISDPPTWHGPMGAVEVMRRLRMKVIAAAELNSVLLSRTCGN